MPLKHLRGPLSAAPLAATATSLNIRNLNITNWTIESHQLGNQWRRLRSAYRGHRDRVEEITLGRGISTPWPTANFPPPGAAMLSLEVMQIAVSLAFIGIWLFAGQIFIRES